MRCLCTTCLHLIEMRIEWFEFPGADRGSHNPDRISCTVGDDLGYIENGSYYFKDGINQCMEFKDNFYTK